MDWRDELKGTVGVMDEKEIADLTDMEERELLDEMHLQYLENERNMDMSSTPSPIAR